MARKYSKGEFRKVRVSVRVAPYVIKDMDKYRGKNTVTEFVNSALDYYISSLWEEERKAERIAKLKAGIFK